MIVGGRIDALAQGVEVGGSNAAGAPPREGDRRQISPPLHACPQRPGKCCGLLPLYREDVKPKLTGNWTPDGKAERVRLRRDYLELTPEQRMKQVFELSRFMSRVSRAGHQRSGA